MLLRYCSHCGAPHSVDPERASPAYCGACGAVLQFAPPTRRGSPPGAEPAEPVPPPVAIPTAANRFRWPTIRLRHLHGSASFLTSTVVHTALMVLLALIFVPEPQVANVLAITTTRPFHEAEEPLLIEEFQALEIEDAVDAVAQVSSEESLDAAANLNVQETLADEAGDNGAAAGRIVLPEGLLAAAPGSGGGAIAASSASFAKRLRRENAKSGEVQVSLLWNNYNDLDLHVRTPAGEEIFFERRRSRCRGELDVDMNAQGRVSNEPVENIYWPRGRAPYGEYIVLVNHYANHGDTDPTPFEVEVKVDGRAQRFTGVLSFGDTPVIVHRFYRTRGGVDEFYVE